MRDRERQRLRQRGETLSERERQRERQTETETGTEGQSRKNPSITLLFYMNICLCFRDVVWAISLGPPAQLHNILAIAICKIMGIACLRGCSNRTHRFFAAEPT